MDKPTINTNAPIESAKESLKTGAQQIASSLQQGIPPSNEQIGKAIDTTTSFLETKRHEGGVGPQAEKLVVDVERVLEDTKEFLERRNPGDLLQKATIHGTQAAAALGKEGAEQAATLPFTAAEYKGQAKTLFSASTELAQQLVRSGEFRKLLIEFIDIIENALWRVEKNAERQGQQAPSLTGALKQDIATTQSPTKEGLPATQQAAKDIVSRFKYVVREEAGLTEDEKRQLRQRLSSLLRTLKNNPQFHAATQNLLSLFNYLRQDILEALDTNAPAEFKYNFSKATYEAQKFLEGFTGGATLKNFSYNIRNFADQLSNDKRLDNLIDQAKYIFTEALENPQRLTDDQTFINRADQLMANFRGWMREINNNTYLQGIAEEGRTILEAIRDDPLRQKLMNDFQTMLQNFITYGPNNRPQLNMELIHQMKGLVVPLIVEHLRWIPLPRIEGSNDTYDYWFDNVVFSAPDLIPDKIHVRMVSEGDFDLNALSTDNFATLVRLSEEGIRTTLKDVHFWFRRKSFPRTEDSGYATVDFTGDGAKLDIVLAVTNDGEKPFQVRRSAIHIDGINIKVADTRHDFLYNSITTLFAPAIRARLEHSLQESLNSFANTINDQLNRLVIKTVEGVSNLVPTQTGRLQTSAH